MFVFDGKSRQVQVSLAHDQQKGRQSVLDEARRAREQREAARLRQVSATKIQLLVRRWIAQRTLAELAAHEFPDPHATIRRLIVRYTFFARVMQRTRRDPQRLMALERQVDSGSRYIVLRLMQASNSELDEVKNDAVTCQHLMRITLANIPHATAGSTQRSELLRLLVLLWDVCSARRVLLFPTVLQWLLEIDFSAYLDVYAVARRMMLSLGEWEIQLLFSATQPSSPPSPPSSDEAMRSDCPEPPVLLRPPERELLQLWRDVVEQGLNYRNASARCASSGTETPAARDAHAAPTTNILDALFQWSSCDNGDCARDANFHVAEPVCGTAAPWEQVSRIDFRFAAHLFSLLASPSVHYEYEEENGSASLPEPQPRAGVQGVVEISPFSAYCRRSEPVSATLADRTRSAKVGTVARNHWVANLQPRVVLEKLTRLLPLLRASHETGEMERVPGAHANADEASPHGAEALAVEVHRRDLVSVAQRAVLLRWWTEAVHLALFATDVCAVVHEVQHDVLLATSSSGGQPTYLKCMSPLTHLHSSQLGLQVLSDAAESLAAAARFPAEPVTAKQPALCTLSTFEMLCGVYAWPLLAYCSLSESHRRNAFGLFSRLLATPGLLSALWRVFHRLRMRGEDSTTSLSHDPSPPEPCHTDTGSAQGCGGAPEREEFAGFGDIRILHSTTGAADSAVTRNAARPNPGPLLSQALPAAPRPPSSVMSGVHCTASVTGVFWSQHPSLQALFMQIFSHFAGNTDFSDSLDRHVVLDSADAGLLVLILVDIVHRSHLNGVVPDARCVLVAFLACKLLEELHTLDEASCFVQDPVLWLAVDAAQALSVVMAIQHEQWKVAMASEESEPTASAASVGVEGVLRVVTGCCPEAHQAFSRSCAWPREERFARLLLRAPFVVPFDVRTALFSRYLTLSNERRLGVWHGDTVPLCVRRGRVLSDAFDCFKDAPLSEEILGVRFRREDGQLEEGYGVGVFREFLVELCKEGFAAENGFFSVTDDGYVYPNPFSWEATGDPMHLRKISFLGAMVGRGLRSGILQDVPFALHFRNALLGRLNSINNLMQFDPQLYRQLNRILFMPDEEVEALGLTFTYTVEAVGVVHEIQLFDGGRDVAVTTKNRHYYLQCVADFKLNRLGSKQTKAFRDGLTSAVESKWLRIFDSNELAIFLGGDVDAKLNVDDWRENTTYRDEEQKGLPIVQDFWRVVETMSGEQQKKLLKFATAMNRPPILGFRFLSPPFTIHVLPESYADLLPSSATCFCLLKLPAYPSIDVLRSKLLAAIEETNSFGLS